MQIVDEHERIVDAIEARDADAAVAALEDHLNRGEYPTIRTREQALL